LICEVVEIAQQQGYRHTAGSAFAQQLLATFHECTAVLDAGQRVAVGCGPQ
jgi:hypothetical protein